MRSAGRANLIAAAERFVSDNFLMLTIGMSITLALIVPEAGNWLKSHGVSTACIVGIFLLQGTAVRVRGAAVSGATLAVSIVLGTLVAYVLAPAAGYAATAAFRWNLQDTVGFLLMCCSTPTIASGVVISVRAKGDHALALFLTVFLILVGIVVIPFALRLTLKTAAHVDQQRLFSQLLFLVLLPAAVGFVARTRFPAVVGRVSGFAQTASVVLLGTTIFISLAAQSQRLRELTFERLGVLAVAAFVVHGALLAVAHTAARSGCRLPEGAARSLAIVSSQKSLPIAIALWAVAFADVYPLAVVAPVVFHSTQILCDSLLANRWASGDHPEQVSAR